MNGSEFRHTLGRCSIGLFDFVTQSVSSSTYGPFGTAVLIPSTRVGCTEFRRALGMPEGLPLVGEIMASATGTRSDAEHALVLGGRRFTGWDPDGYPEGCHVVSHGVGTDLALARLAVPIVATRKREARVGIAALGQLAQDVRRQRSLGGEQSRAVARVIRRRHRRSAKRSSSVRRDRWSRERQWHQRILP